jgi:hypothetical protein
MDPEATRLQMIAAAYGGLIAYSPNGNAQTMAQQAINLADVMMTALQGQSSGEEKPPG